MTQSILEQSFELLDEINKLVDEIEATDDEIKHQIILRKIKMYKAEMEHLMEQFEKEELEEENKLKGEQNE